MSEVMIWHAPKRNKEGKVTVQSGSYYNVLPSDSRVREAVKAAVSRGWPFVMHIEFAGLLKQEGGKRRDLFMKEFERLLDDYPRHPFVLNKVGQLPAAAARAIAHGNAERLWRQAPP